MDRRLGTRPQDSCAWVSLALALLLVGCRGSMDRGAGPGEPSASQGAVTAQDSPSLTPGALGVTTPEPETCLKRDELAQLSLSERAGLAEICFLSDDGLPTIVDQTRHIEGIRAFLGDPARLIAFREVTSMPNSPNGDLRTALYEDERGLQYYYADAANKVVEMSPASYNPVPSSPSLPEDELRARAEALIARELPEFESMRSRLTASGGRKGTDLHFFRWEDPTGMAWTSMPPLAQVGITGSGEVFSYINTLFYLK